MGLFFRKAGATSEDSFDLSCSRCTGVVIFAIVITATVLLAAMGSRRMACEARMRQLCDQAQAAGFPIELAELNDWYPTPPRHDNAAECLLPWIIELGHLSCGPRRNECQCDQFLAPTGPLAPDRVTDWLAFRDKHADMFDALHYAADRPACRYPIDLSLGGEAPNPCFQGASAAVRLLLMDAVVYAEQQQPDEAARSLVDAVRLQRTLLSMPLYVSAFQGSQLQNDVSRVCHHLLRRTQFSDDSLCQLDRELDCNADPLPLVRTIAAERVMATSVPAARRPRPAVLEPRMRLNLMQQHTDILLALLDNLERSPQLLAKDLTIELPAMSILLQAHIAHVAHVRLTRAAIAVERYRLANGRLPDNLAQLTPRWLAAVPRDPLTGGPLQYQLRDEGYTVSCQGAALPNCQWKKTPLDHPSRRIAFTKP